MKKRLISAFFLVIYSAILVRVIVFKDIPTIRLGHLMIRMGGPETGHQANLIPFKTILPYLLGYKGWIIAGINLGGNIIPLVPIGFLVPLLYPKMTWKKSLLLAIIVPLIIELLQAVFHVGIFDIDDVILNGFGVMVGYWIFVILYRKSVPHQTLSNHI